MCAQASFRFYAELNDFLPVNQKHQSFDFIFQGNPSVKDSIEAIGVPHTEIDLILVNGQSVDFSYHLRDHDYISVYPVFESLDISPLVKLRAEPLRKIRFILDVHLGKLARKLRLLGFDTLYRNDYQDAEIIRLALKEKRIILTRDRGILKTGRVSHGFWIRSNQADSQIAEVLNRFQLYAQIKAFHRCTVCNGIVRRIDKETIRDRLLPRTVKYYDEFYRCTECDRIYWKGSHYRKMEVYIQRLSESGDH
jgi:uncharacterized protein with PIN domain